MITFKVIGSTGERSFSAHHVRSKRKAIAFAQEMAREWWVVRVIGPKGVVVAQFRNGETVEAEG